MRKIIIITGTALAAISAHGHDIYEQANTGHSNMVSQEFPDFPEFTTYSSDDVKGLGSIRLIAARAYGTEAGLSSENLAVMMGLGTTPDIDSVFSLATGTQVHEDLVFTSLDLRVSGDFHIFFWVNRPFTTGNQWFWNQTKTVTGGQTMVHNPGGAFGFGSDPFPVSLLLNEPLDCSFRLEYEIVPEPVSLLAIGLGLAGLGVRHRNSPKEKLATERT